MATKWISTVGFILAFASAFTSFSCGDPPPTSDTKAAVPTATSVRDPEIATPTPSIPEPVATIERPANQQATPSIPPAPPGATSTPGPAGTPPTEEASKPPPVPTATPPSPTPTPIPKPVGYNHGLEHGFSLVQTHREPSADRQGWVDITLALAVTRFGPDEEAAGEISYEVLPDSICFHNSQLPNDCISVVWGSQEQFVGEFADQKKTGPFEVPFGAALLLPVTFQVAENATKSSLIAGEDKVPVDLSARVGSVQPEVEPLPAPTPKGSDGTDAYFMDDSYGIAITGVSSEPDSDSPVLVTAEVGLSVLSLNDNEELAPGIQISDAPGRVCFASVSGDECIEVRWGDRDEFSARLSLSGDAPETWPRGHGWQAAISFKVPGGVKDATLLFGDQELPIDLRGMKGASPAFSYMAHFPEFSLTSGSTLYDSDRMSVTLENVHHEVDSGDVVLAFRTSNNSEGADFKPQIELRGTRLSAGGIVFDGYLYSTPPAAARPPRPQVAPSSMSEGDLYRATLPRLAQDPWVPNWEPHSVVATDTLAPGQSGQLELRIPRSGINRENWNDIPFVFDWEDRPDGFVFQLVVSDATADSDPQQTTPAYIQFERTSGERRHWSGELVWLFRAGTDMIAGPATADGIVYVGANNIARFGPTTDWGHLYALDAITGEQLWRYQTGRRTAVSRSNAPRTGYVNTSPVAAEGVVYVGSADGYLHAVDAATGEQLWKVDLKDPIHAIAGVEGGVVYMNSSNNLYAADARTGEVLWNVGLEIPWGTSASIGGGVVCLSTYIPGSSESYIHAIDAHSGEELWKLLALGTSFPVVEDGLVYFGTVDGLHAMDSRTGIESWTADLGGAFIVGQPAVEGDVLYAITSDDVLLAVDAKTGATLWETEGRGGASIVIASEVLYMSSHSNRLHVIDSKTGDPVFDFEAQHNPSGLPPVVSGDLVFVGSDSAYIHAVVAAVP